MMQRLRHKGAMTRRQLADETALSWGCISELIGMLVADGTVIEEKLPPSDAKGRIPSILTLSDCKKILNILKLNLADNKAELSSHPGKKFQVSWKSNNITLHGLSSKGRNTFLMDYYCRHLSGDKIVPRGEYRSANSCVSVLEYTVDYWCGLRIFPIIEKFYLTGIE